MNGQEKPALDLDVDVPRDPVANAEWRGAAWAACEVNSDMQEAMWRRCANDLLFWINTFVWIFDPKAAKTLPFITWPYQDEVLTRMLQAVWAGWDLLIEKSRQMGVSWMAMILFLWLWTFHPHIATLAISRVEDLVDKPGDPDTLFWKFRFARDHLPTWMRPATREATLHIENLLNASVLDGRATSQDAARAGTRKAVLVDEHASIPHAEEVETATADVADCRIRVSTPKGMNTFGKLRHSGRVKVLTIHWSKHPEKARGLYTWAGDALNVLDPYRGPVTTTRIDPDTNQPVRLTFNFPDQYPFQQPAKDPSVRGAALRSPWYDGECVRRASDIDIAQELDIDYLRSGHAWFDAVVVAGLRATTVRPPDLRGRVRYTLMPDESIRVEGWAEEPVGALRLWLPLDTEERPTQRANYAAACDISEGTGASNSVCSIVDCGAGRKVAEYATSYESPEKFARSVVAVCRWFGGGTVIPFLAWELNGPGLIFGKEVVRLRYEYLYFQRREESIRPRKKPGQVPGWASTQQNRYILLGDYRRDLGLGTFVNPSGEAVDELLQYVIDEQGYPLHEKLVEEKEGARLAHGDRVIADALVNMARKEQPKFEMPDRAVASTSYLARRHAALLKERPCED